MKKIIFVLFVGVVLSTAGICVAGDFNVTGNLTVDSKIGIGTSTPITTLDVRNGNPTGYLGSSSFGALFAAENPSSYFVGLASVIQRSNTALVYQSAYGARMSAAYTGSGNLTSTDGGLVGYANAVAFKSASGTPTITKAIGLMSQPWIAEANSGFVTVSEYIGAYFPRISRDGSGVQFSNYKHIYIEAEPFPISSGNSVLSGIWLDKQIAGTTDYGVVLNGDGSGADIVFGQGQDASIYWDGTNLVFDTNKTDPNAVAYFSSKVSFTDYIDRTSVWDKAKGKALNSLRDNSQLTDAAGKIIHENFPEKVTYQVTDYNNCWDVIKKVEHCWKENDEEVCVSNITDVPEKVTSFTKEQKFKECAKKDETGVSMSMRAAKHEQALFEAYQMIKTLQSELCSKDSSYSWCNR